MTDSAYWNTIRLKNQIDALERETERLRKMVSGYQHHLRECEQIAGQALGYPWYKDDRKNFPGATEVDGVCIGKHVGDPVVADLAFRFLAAREIYRQLIAFFTCTRSTPSYD